MLWGILTLICLEPISTDLLMNILNCCIPIQCYQQCISQLESLKAQQPLLTNNDEDITQSTILITNVSDHFPTILSAN